MWPLPCKLVWYQYLGRVLVYALKFGTNTELCSTPKVGDLESLLINSHLLKRDKIFRHT